MTKTHHDSADGHLASLAAAELFAVALTAATVAGLKEPNTEIGPPATDLFVATGSVAVVPAASEGILTEPEP